MKRRYISCVLAIWLCTVGLAGGSGCSASPATGKMQFALISDEDEISIGEGAAPELIEGYGGPIPSSQIQQYVVEIGTTLAEHSERPDLPWEFHVLDSEVVNAFALPGGQVFVSRGLLARMDNEAQLAGVLGHEIGHVTDRHGNVRVSRAVGAQVLVTAASIAVGSNYQIAVDLFGAGSGVFMLSFSRSEELAADELGVRYMTRAGYNPLGQAQLLQIFVDIEKEGDGTVELLSTHPNPEARVERILEIIAEEYPEYEEPGYYRFHEGRFHEKVLNKLETLPEPAHGAKEPLEDDE